MFDFIQNFIYFVLSVQDKLFGKKSCFSDNACYSNSTTKTAFSEAASLELNGQTNKKREKVKNNIEHIIKKSNGEPKHLIKYIRKNGTMVYIKPFAKTIMKLIGTKDNFISPQTGIKAIILSICTSGKPALKTNALFLLENQNPEKSNFIQQFYKWYSMKFNLPGFDEKSQTNFQKFMNNNTCEVKELSIEEIIGLKEAIARDVEAINFVVELAKTTDGSKSAMKKITAGGASI